MKRVLVTGGAGFIGSHVCDALLARGDEVVVVDDLSTGRRENLAAGARFHEVDLRDEARLARVFADERPTAVCHQAAQASVAASVLDPLRDASINVMGGLGLLRLAVAGRVERFVFASTGGAIYGEIAEGRATERDAALPLSPYACAKLAFEGYLRAFAHHHRLGATTLRYANVYGPRQDPHGEAGVVAIFLRRLIAGAPIQLNARRAQGDDGCVRDYVYVRDVVRANLAAIDGAIPDAVLNVGSGVATTTRALAERLAAQLGRAADLVPAPHRAGDVERSVLDPSRCEELLGPATPLDEGLAATAAWYATRAV